MAVLKSAGMSPELSAELHAGMLAEGVQLFHGSGFLSAAHTETDVEQTAAAFAATLARLPAGPAPRVTDLALAGGRVWTRPGHRRRLDIGVTAGRFCHRRRRPGRETIDASGLVLVPGLVDLHTHLYSGVSHYGIDPDEHCLRRGVTTAVDAGSAGAQTFPGFRRYVIEPADTRVFAFLHVAVQGMITSLVGELEDLRWASPDQAVARAREHPDVIVGVKVRLGLPDGGQRPAAGAAPGPRRPPGSSACR